MTMTAPHVYAKAHLTIPECVQARELEHWDESPEEFHHQSDSAAYRDNVRPCAELLFATLLQVSNLSLPESVLDAALQN